MPSDLARTLFPVELKVQITNIKITHHRVIEDICIHLWIICWFSPCCISVWKKMFANGAIMFHFKRTGVLQRTLGIVVFIDLNTYVLNGMNFKTFLKENYAIALLDSCYLLKKYWARNWTSCSDCAYGVFIL